MLVLIASSRCAVIERRECENSWSVWHMRPGRRNLNISVSVVFKVSTWRKDSRCWRPLSIHQTQHSNHCSHGQNQEERYIILYTDHVHQLTDCSGTSGNAKNYITRSQAVRKLQVSLPDFRRLCIFKGATYNYLYALDVVRD